MSTDPTNSPSQSILDDDTLFMAFDQASAWTLMRELRAFDLSHTEQAQEVLQFLLTHFGMENAIT